MNQVQTVAIQRGSLFREIVEQYWLCFISDFLMVAVLVLIVLWQENFDGWYAFFYVGAFISATLKIFVMLGEHKEWKTKSV